VNKSFFPWLVVSLFVDLETDLLLAGYGTSMGAFWGFSDLPFSW
jgi:hypothetical protein